MDDKIAKVFVIVIVLIAVALIIWGAVSTISDSRQSCANDAETLRVEYRMKGGCQLKNADGIWLNEHDYLLLSAVDNR